MTDVEQDVARLETLSLAELRTLWANVTNTPAPKISAKMLHLALAWEIQAKAYGGHSRETIRKLDQIARGLTRTSPVRPGMRLVREWQGRAHIVTIDDDETIRWEDREYRSLSEVARAITGTRWSGPAFFGLKRKAA